MCHIWKSTKGKVNIEDAKNIFRLYKGKGKWLTLPPKDANKKFNEYALKLHGTTSSQGPTSLFQTEDKQYSFIVSKKTISVLYDTYPEIIHSAKDETVAVKEKAKVPDPTDSWPYRIIQRTSFQDYKVSYDLRIDAIGGKLPNEKVLADISRNLRSSNKGFKKMFVCFYLPGMKVDAGAFATAHYTPKLNVRINDFMVPARYK
ncbi:hypothetical protein BVX97_00460 [bacterium E08(2017)]|nr:hypothetical protein BVX97_00460 [bacterium E08(2017)]